MFAPTDKRICVISEPVLYYSMQYSKIKLAKIAVVSITPEFIYPIDNITVATGRDASFTCVVNYLQGHKVGKSLLF